MKTVDFKAIVIKIDYDKNILYLFANDCDPRQISLKGEKGYHKTDIYEYHVKPKTIFDYRLLDTLIFLNKDDMTCKKYINPDIIRSSDCIEVFNSIILRMSYKLYPYPTQKPPAIYKRLIYLTSHSFYAYRNKNNFFCSESFIDEDRYTELYDWWKSIIDDVSKGKIGENTNLDNFIDNMINKYPPQREAFTNHDIEYYESEKSRILTGLSENIKKTVVDHKINICGIKEYMLSGDNILDNNYIYNMLTNVKEGEDLPHPIIFALPYKVISDKHIIPDKRKLNKILKSLDSECEDIDGIYDLLVIFYQYFEKYGGIVNKDTFTKFFKKTVEGTDSYRQDIMDNLTYYMGIDIYKETNFMMTMKARVVTNICLSSLISRIDRRNHKPIVEYKKDDELTDQQNDAVKNAVEYYISILTGAGGCGKTHTIASLVRLLVNQGKSVQMTSFTGKAVMRMKDMCKLIECDIHEDKKDLLREAKTMDMLISTKRINKFDYLIIDEATMIDNSLFARFVKRYDSIYPILLVGDNHQLQPIGHGCLFFTCFSLEKTIKRVVLTKNFRIKDQSDEKVLLENINSLRTANPVFKTGIDFEQCITEDDDKSYEICEFIIKSYKEAKISAYYIKFLSFFNEPLSKLNNLVNKYYHSNNKTYDNIFFTKQYIICNANLYNIGLFNGTEGIIRNVTQDSIEIYFFSVDKRVSFTKTYGNIVFVNRSYKFVPGSSSKDDLHIMCKCDDVTEYYKGDYPFVCSYSTSVHKSQGSEYPTVILFMPHKKVDKSFLSKNLLYTALSRAKNEVKIIGNVDMLKECFYKNKEVNRDALFEVLTDVYDENKDIIIDEVKKPEDDYNPFDDYDSDVSISSY